MRIGGEITIRGGAEGEEAAVLIGVVRFVKRGEDWRIRDCQVPGLRVAAIGVEENIACAVMLAGVAVRGQGKGESRAEGETQEEGG